MRKQFPKMLYKLGGDVVINKVGYSSFIVNSDKEEAEAYSDGWVNVSSIISEGPEGNTKIVKKRGRKPKTEL